MEDKQANLKEAANHYRRFLEALGLGDAFESISLTSQKATSLLHEWTKNASQSELSLSCMDAPRNPSWVSVQNIQFYSFCEHDMVPFFGVADLIFLPHKKIAGFGGFARVIDSLSRKPQLQERLTEEVADAINDALKPQALLLRLSARQLCLEMRGRGAGILCTSFAERGKCQTDSEFRSLAQSRLERTMPIL